MLAPLLSDSQRRQASLAAEAIMTTDTRQKEVALSS